MSTQSIEANKYVFSIFVGYDQDNGWSDRNHEYDVIAYNIDEVEDFVKNREILPEFHDKIRVDGDINTTTLEIDQVIVQTTGEHLDPATVDYDEKIHISRTDWVEITNIGEYKDESDLRLVGKTF